MPAVIKNKHAVPVSLPYPYRGILNAGQSILVNLTPAAALAALGVVGGRTNTVFDVRASNATSGFDVTRTGDALAGIDGALASVPNEVVVQSLSDFPTPVANVITLVADTVYSIVGIVDIGVNALLLSDGVELRGRSSALRDQIVSSNTGALFRVIDPLAEVELRRFNCVTTGALLAVDCKTLVLTEVDFTCATVGTVHTTRATSISRMIFFGFSTGLTFTGANVSCSFDTVGFVQTDGTGGNRCLDLGTATFSVVSLATTNFVVAVNGFGIGGLAASANVPSGRGIVITSTFNGAGAALDVLTHDDLRWRYALNEGVPDSVTSGSFKQNAGMESTSITGSTKLNLTTTAGVLHRFSAPINNRLVLASLAAQTIRASMCLSVEKTGGAVDFDFGVAVNGTIVADVKGVEITTKRILISCTFELPTVNTSDTVELFANTAAGPVTINVTGAELLLRI